MRNATRISLCPWLLVAALALGGAATPGCGRRSLPGSETGGNGAGGSVGILGVGGGGGFATTGAGGTAGVAVACAGASDARLVVAGQRILLLTKAEIVNTVRYLIDATEADALLSSGMFSITSFTEMHFPPADGEQQSINPTSILPLNNLAEHVGDYVLANFATLTRCQTATDACARIYLGRLAARAYRRQLTPDEQSRFTALYDKLRATQIVNGYEVTFTVEEATSYAVNALLTSPQMLWRWELGDPAMASTAPAGIPLTDQELATQVAFFLTDQPPDDFLLEAAAAGTLRANLPAHVGRILQTQTARTWMRSVMELYFLINQLPTVPIDKSKFPAFDSGLMASMLVDAERFLDTVLWTGGLDDLLLSRTAFVNTRLATDVYKIPVPAGAGVDQFVQVSLPATQRSGILTNAAFLTARGRSDGLGLIVPRGKTIRAAMLCLPLPAPDLSQIGPQVQAAATNVAQQTGQEQVAARAAVPFCKSCHALFDPFGLALEQYDNLGTYRTNYDYLPGMPAIDAHATLPPELGSVMVNNAVELAQVLVNSPTFINCMAASMLQYAMVDLSASVDLLLPPQRAGCATADVVQRFQGASAKTFTDLVQATAAAPAFVLRRAAP
jgi:uncharacterized protein DUF1592/uncharacterized protein DUF1588/uncharacterized protein DUF1595